MCKDKKETKKKSKAILTQESIRKASEKAAEQTNRELGMDKLSKK